MKARDETIFKVRDDSIEKTPIAIILTHIEYKNIPFGHLSQMDMLGLVNIYILLNESES